MPLYVIFLCAFALLNKIFYKVYLRAKIFDCLDAHFGSVCTYILWGIQDVRSKRAFFHYRIMEVLGPVFHRIPPSHFRKEEDELCRSQITWARSYRK